jgi:hypothetical protein
MKSLGQPLLGATLLANEAEACEIEAGASETSHTNVRRQSKMNKQIFSIGLFLFTSSFLFNALGDYDTGGGPGGSAVNVQKSGWEYLAFSVLSAAGLLLMTITDLDINTYLRRSRVQLVVFMLLWILAWGYDACKYRPNPLGYVFWLVCLPFTYCFARFEQVASMKEGYPLVTELLVMGFILSCWCLGVFYLSYAHSAEFEGKGLPRWPIWIIGKDLFCASPLSFIVRRACRFELSLGECSDDSSRMDLFSEAQEAAVGHDPILHDQLHLSRLYRPVRRSFPGDGIRLPRLEGD